MTFAALNIMYFGAKFHHIYQNSLRIDMLRMPDAPLYVTTLQKKPQKLEDDAAAKHKNEDTYAMLTD